MDLRLEDDPSDFTSPLLSALDSSLRCSICREFYTAPVSLPCAHSFCSICIRASLDAADRDNKKCPSCGKSGVNERDLRMNTSLEEAVDRYREARSEIVSLTTRATVASSSSSTRPGASRKRRRTSSDDEIIEVGSDELEEVIPKPKLGKGKKSSPPSRSVKCPLCDRSVPEVTINQHLDSSCKKFLAKPSSLSTSSSKSQTAPLANAWNSIFSGSGSSSKEDQISASASSSSSTQRLPRINLHVMTDTQVKEKLSSLGLPTTGPRSTLEARVKQWTILYNSNWDSSHPRKITELKVDLRKWEEARSSEVKAKEKRAKKGELGDEEYQKEHKDEFAALEAKVRARMKKEKLGTSGGSRSTESEVDEGGENGADIELVDDEDG